MRSDLGKPTRRPMRWNDYDYRQSGAYFITICAYERRSAFGRVLDGAMFLNRYGEIINEMWQMIPQHFPHVALDAWQIMPNHVHGIIIIPQNPVGAGSPRPFSHQDYVHQPSETISGETISGGETPPLRGLSQIVGYFKYQTTRCVNIQRQYQNWSPVQIWQRGYYDRVIRNERELHEEQRYIAENPQNWDSDENHV